MVEGYQADMEGDPPAPDQLPSHAGQQTVLKQNIEVSTTGPFHGKFHAFADQNTELTFIFRELLSGPALAISRGVDKDVCAC